MAARSPEPVDIQAGKLIRGQRLALGMSQAALAEKLGLAFQQVQKYEKGPDGNPR
jgi:transcriptional regulator with XRE-family HTH domain